MADSLGLLTPDSPLGKIQQSINPSKAELGSKKLAEDFDDFLLLLTTQLKNQDPSEPLDTNEFTSQLVEFASVEQAVATNLNLEKLVASSNAAGIQQGLGYIGKSVEALGNKGVLSNGSAAFSYELPQDAFEVSVTILDTTGRAVFTGKGDTQAGKNLVLWDGVNSLTGQPMPDGTYQVVVKAKDFKQEDIEATTYTTGRVTAAEVDAEGNTILSVGSAKVKVGDVLAVREIPASVTIPAPERKTGTDNALSDKNTLTGLLDNIL